MTPRLVVLLLAAGCAMAQSVRVYSEFERIDPFGSVVAADRAETPREVLSPAVIRNGFASFLVAVEPPPGQPHSLFIGQNPEHSVDVTMYRAVFAKHGNEWIPDGLTPVTLSETGLVEDAEPQVPGQTVFVYWLDLRVDRDAPARRNRLEIQLNWGSKWFIYPMELRVLTARAPRPAGAMERVAPVESPSAESARVVLAEYLCGAPAPGEDGPVTVRKLIRRNARQDAALARSLEARVGRAALITELTDAAGGQERGAWCKAPAPPRELGAEWYLRVRDYLYRTADRLETAGLPPGDVVITVKEQP